MEEGGEAGGEGAGGGDGEILIGSETFDTEVGTGGGGCRWWLCAVSR